MESSWDSLDLSSVGAGAFIGLRRGRGSVQGSYTVANRSHQTAKDVVVIPAGTYLLKGQILELGFPESPVPDVRIEVTTGPALAL